MEFTLSKASTPDSKVITLPPNTFGRVEEPWKFKWRETFCKGELHQTTRYLQHDNCIPIPSSLNQTTRSVVEEILCFFLYFEYVSKASFWVSILVFRRLYSPRKWSNVRWNGVILKGNESSSSPISFQSGCLGFPGDKYPRQHGTKDSILGFLRGGCSREGVTGEP